MSYGYGSQIQAVLNRNKHKASTTFKKMKKTGSASYGGISFEKKATPHQLRKIREEMQAENRKNLKNKIFFFIVFLILIIYLLVFYPF